MWSEAELERDREEARRKWQLDYNTGIKEARLEGFAEGLAEAQRGFETGIRMGQIRVCQLFLRQPQTPVEELRLLSSEELTQRAEELMSLVFSKHQLRQ